MENTQNNLQQIISLVDKLNQLKIIDGASLKIFRLDDSEENNYSVTIRYSTDMYVLSDKLNYALDDLRGLENHRLADIQIRGFIELFFNVEDTDYDLNEILVHSSNVDVYASWKLQGESNDWIGYEIDNQIKTDNLIVYLNELIETCEMCEK